MRLPVIFAAPAAAALLTAPAAFGHVDLEPGLVEPGSQPLLTFTVPNDEEGVGPITGFSVALPVGTRLLAAEAKPGWEASVGGNTVRWTGSRIPEREYGDFTLRLLAPRKTGSIELVSRTRYASGTELRIPLELLVAPTPDAVRPSAGRDEGARTLGKAALGVALAAAAVALGAGFLGLWLWLRRGD